MESGARSAGPSIWASGAHYEAYVGRWSRLVAWEFVPALQVRPEARWVDVGCGTGALTAAVLELAEPREVVALDPSQGFVAHARAAIADPRARFQVASAQPLPLPDGAVDAVVSGLVLNFVPAAPAAVAEAVRATASGGTVAAYVWDYAGRMELIRRFWDAACELDPAARGLDEGRRFPLCAPDRLTDLFQGAGLEQVACWAIDVPAVFRDFDDLWSPFLGGQAPAPAYAASLSEDRRRMLRERLSASIGREPDGSIRLTAGAWAVRGRVPGP